MTADESGAEWEPAFPGQREPFQPGHEKSLRHGAYSPRRVGERAAQILAGARSSAGWPSYLADASFEGEIVSWAHAEAIVALLREHVDGMDLVEALSDTVREESDEVRAKGRSTRLTTSRRTAAALQQLHTAENRAARMRSRLGLEPTARAKLQRDLAAGRYMAGLTSTHPLIAALDQRAAERAALEGGTDD